MRLGSALWIALVLVVSCGDKSEKVTRAQCNKVADHIADLIMNHYTSHPDELWDGMADPHGTGIPATVTKASFPSFLASPAGQTWTMQRKGQVRSSAEAGIEPCMKDATPELVRCLLAATTREGITACDKAHPSRRGSDDTGHDQPRRDQVTGQDPAK